MVSSLSITANALFVYSTNASRVPFLRFFETRIDCCCEETMTRLRLSIGCPLDLRMYVFYRHVENVIQLGFHPIVDIK